MVWPKGAIARAWQRIVNQMEYRPIKRRLENGTYYWALFTEENIADAADAVADAVANAARAYVPAAALAAADGGGLRRPDEPVEFDWRAAARVKKGGRGNRARVRNAAERISARPAELVRAQRGGLATVGSRAAILLSRSTAAPFLPPPPPPG